MKQLLVIIAALALIVPVYSQDSVSYTDKKNEINIGFFNAFELNNISDLGIGYKRMTKNGAWRVGTGFGFSTSNSDNDNGGLQTHNYFSISPRIGHEWHQNFKRLQLQYGTDWVTDFSSVSLENENTDYYRLYESKETRVSIRPFLGLKVFLTKSISISTETYMDIAYSKGTIEESYDPSSSTTSTEQGASVTLGPLGVFSINFHF